MEKPKEFTVDKVSWHTKRERNYEFDSGLVFAYFKVLFEYLQERGLTTRRIINEGEEITEETQLLSSDLTSEGLELIKKTLDKWTESILDKGKSPTDIKLLDKYLDKIRSESN